MDIVYTSAPEREYTAALGKCKSAAELVALTEKYRRIADDAHQVAKAMTDQDFADFAAGLKKERRGKFAGKAFAKKYGCVMMPETMIMVGMLAQQYGAPFGCAFIQATKAGLITEKDGIATFREATP